MRSTNVPVKSTPVVAGSVFINEIHYDNAGTDSNEGVEIAGLAELTLQDGKSFRITEWSKIPLSGTLSGVIPNQLNGYGFISSYSGLQNGSPDGIALVDASNKVIQFLSYEGAFKATNGPAIGMTSTDIGIAQTSTKR
jgi:hypothetical protein